MNDAAARAKQFFETLDEASLARIDTVYAPGAYFKDPFNEVDGVEAIRRIFAHMFVQIDAPRFVVKDVVCEGDQALMTWDFHFRMRRFNRERQVIHGASHLRFAADGRVAFHRDYWDAAEELYEKLPFLGGLMRWLKRRAAG
jgi:ketosteroid isomerase-like protein